MHRRVEEGSGGRDGDVSRPLAVAVAERLRWMEPAVYGDPATASVLRHSLPALARLVEAGEYMRDEPEEISAWSAALRDVAAALGINEAPTKEAP